MRETQQKKPQKIFTKEESEIINSNDIKLQVDFYDFLLAQLAQYQDEYEKKYSEMSKQNLTLEKITIQFINESSPTSDMKKEITKLLSHVREVEKKLAQFNSLNVGEKIVEDVGKDAEDEDSSAESTTVNNKRKRDAIDDVTTPAKRRTSHNQLEDYVWVSVESNKLKWYITQIDAAHNSQKVSHVFYRRIRKKLSIDSSKQKVFAMEHATLNNDIAIAYYHLESRFIVINPRFAALLFQTLDTAPTIEGKVSLDKKDIVRKFDFFLDFVTAYQACMSGHEDNSALTLNTSLGNSASDDEEVLDNDERLSTDEEELIHPLNTLETAVDDKQEQIVELQQTVEQLQQINASLESQLIETRGQLESQLSETRAFMERQFACFTELMQRKLEDNEKKFQMLEEKFQKQLDEKSIEVQALQTQSVEQKIEIQALKTQVNPALKTLSQKEAQNGRRVDLVIESLEKGFKPDLEGVKNQINGLNSRFNGMNNNVNILMREGLHGSNPARGNQGTKSPNPQSRPWTFLQIPPKP